jgi:hypothetical protein
MRFKIDRPSPALIISCIALLIALGPAVRAANTVGSRDIIDESILSQDIKNGEVRNSDLATNAVTGPIVLNKSLTMADIAGADVRGSIGFSLAGNSCGTLTFGVSGALPGDVVVMALTGNVALSNKIVLSAVDRVTAANTIKGTACNLSANSVSVSDLGVRILTFR